MIGKVIHVIAPVLIEDYSEDCESRSHTLSYGRLLLAFLAFALRFYSALRHTENASIFWQHGRYLVHIELIDRGCTLREIR